MSSNECALSLVILCIEVSLRLNLRASYSAAHKRCGADHDLHKITGTEFLTVRNMLVSKEGITLLLNEWSGGDPAALERLVPLVYSDLRRMARVRLNKERRPNHTMQSTDLADEVLLRFLKQRSLHSWENRDSFYRVASSVMRNILVEYARHHWAKKRGAEHRVDFSFAKSEPSPERNAMLVLLVDDALRRLAAHDEDLADLVELKYFGGFENEEIAEVLGVSPATVKRKWKTAKAWLSSELKPTHGS